MPPLPQHTVSIAFVRGAVQRLDAATRQGVLQRAAIAPELLAADAARVPAAAFAALWLAVGEALDDEFFGLDRRRMKVGSFALLCHAVLPSGHLERALRRMLRGFGLFLDDVSATLGLQDGEAVVTLDNRIVDPEARRFADETFLVMVHGLASWLAGRRLPLRAAEFAHPAPAHAAEYAVMFTRRVAFDAVATAIRLEAGLLSAPVVQDEAALKAFLRVAPQSVFLKYKNEVGWSARLRRRLRRSVGQPDWPVLEDVARELHVAPTTLRRRLEAEGSSYQGIKDELRRDVAIHRLCTTRLSIAEVGRLVGFREPSAFHRAFKKWCGVQPGEYRARQSGPP